MEGWFGWLEKLKLKNSASLAAAGLSLAINLEKFEKIFVACISVVTSVFSNYSRKYQKCVQLFRDTFMTKNDFYTIIH